MEDKRDTPMESLIEEKKKKREAASEQTATTTTGVASAATPTEPASDSDDDQPIINLVKKRMRLEADKEKEKKNKDKESEKEKEKSSKKKSNSGSNADEEQTSTRVLQGIGSTFYENTQKGALVQSFLKRWWYALEWPIISELPQPPPGFEALDGLPGVYVSTRTDTLGKVLDLRDSKTCPNLINYSKKTSAELKVIAATAIENQIKKLKEVEPDNSALLLQLQKELNEVKSVDADKADRDAKKYTFD